ncbi:MAG: 50S ribosomal protein L24 [Chloroflexi bacterium]|nr:50S ribosomal protein L24 [Chloroflexota bacterium]
MKIVKNDTVIVMSGKDKGKTGKVRRSYPGEERIIVEGVNMIKRHAKARGAARQAGIIELEAPIHVSKVMLVCTKCNRPARVATRFVEAKKVRLCSSCHEVIE